MKQIITINTILIIFGLLVLPTNSQETYLHSTSDKKVVELSDEQFMEMVKEKVEPQYPPGCHCIGKVTGKMIVNKIGKVIKVKMESGHPLLRVNVQKALKKWRFRQLIVEGKPVQYSGTVTYTYQ